jgi:hypothetical protein
VAQGGGGEVEWSRRRAEQSTRLLRAWLAGHPHRQRSTKRGGRGERERAVTRTERPGGNLPPDPLRPGDTRGPVESGRVAWGAAPGWRPVVGRRSSGSGQLLGEHGSAGAVGDWSGVSAATGEGEGEGMCVRAEQGDYAFCLSVCNSVVCTYTPLHAHVTYSSRSLKTEKKIRKDFVRMEMEL